MPTTITTQNWDGVTAPALPAGWVSSGANVKTFDAGFSPSAPNALSQYVVSGGATPDCAAFFSTPATSGDVQLSHIIAPYKVDGAVYLCARATGTYLFALNCYAVEWRGASATSPGLAIGTLNNGAFAVLGSRLAGAIFDNSANYTVSLTCTGTTLAARVQRSSDSKWLKPDGTWQVAALDAISLADTTITRCGYAGVAFWTPTLAGSGIAASSDNFSFTQTDRAATTFYLASAGNDNNNGTTTLTPWATIGKLNGQALVPGDTVSLNGGDTFSGNLVLSGGGTSGNIVTLTRYGVGNPTISCGNGDGVLALNMGYVTIDSLIVVGSGITITAGSPFAATNSTGSGVRVLSTIATGSRFSSITVTNNDVSGLHDGVLIHTPIAGLKTFPGDIAAFSGPSVVGFDGITDSNNVVHEILVNANVVWGSATSAAFGGGFLPTGNTTFKNITANNNQIYNNYGTPVGVGVIAQPIAIFNSSSGTLTGNVMYSNGSTGGKTSHDAGGIGALVILESDSIVVRQNEAYNNFTNLTFDGCGFDLDGGATNCTMEYNYSHDNDGAGFQCGVFTGSGTNTGNIFRYNVSVRDNRKNGSGGLLCFGGNANWYGNTVYIGSSSVAAALAVSVVDGNHGFYNNIFYVQAGQAQANIQTGSSVAFQGNLYWASDGSFKCIKLANTRTTLATWRSGDSQELLNAAPVGVWADPQLQNIGGTLGYFLPATPVSTLTDGMPFITSPARKAGLDLLANFTINPGTLDFQQTSNLDGGLLSIGAFSVPLLRLERSRVSASTGRRNRARA